MGVDAAEQPRRAHRESADDQREQPAASTPESASRAGPDREPGQPALHVRLGVQQQLGEPGQHREQGGGGVAVRRRRPGTLPRRTGCPARPGRRSAAAGLARPARSRPAASRRARSSPDHFRPGYAEHAVTGGTQPDHRLVGLLPTDGDLDDHLVRLVVGRTRRRGGMHSRLGDRPVDRAGQAGDLATVVADQDRTTGRRSPRRRSAGSACGPPSRGPPRARRAPAGRAGRAGPGPGRPFARCPWRGRRDGCRHAR